ncbi:SPOR domain-containing protein [Colwellia sp. RE-S-Sl-9]
MSSVESTIKSFDERQSVTTISVNARIDYILRFSKHAVLVIDNDPDVYANVGNEFLGSLSKEHNAAFVSISSKLNDIQIRCRIIEQLFGNTLFDPEQPLSVNVIKLSEAKNEAITIVIANAESLSLQLTHELCQLAEIAKKLNKTINVLLLGRVQAAINLSENKHLFDNKVSILLAENGQLIGLNSSLLKKDSAWGFSKFFLILIALLIGAAILSVAFIKRDIFESNTTEINELEAEPLNIDEYKKEFVEVKLPKLETNSLNKDIKPIVATPKEVFQLLIANAHENINEVNSDKNVSDETLAATQINESLSEPNEDKTGLLANKTLKLVDQEAAQVVINTALAVKDSKKNESHDDKDYYQKSTKGYVIQLASFEKITGFKSFLNTYKNSELYGYSRRLKGAVSHIVTTRIYNTNAEAKTAINELPQALRQRGPWIKSVQAVNNEINLYNNLDN